jgi:hypothetical protein
VTRVLELYAIESDHGGDLRGKGVELLLKQAPALARVEGLKKLARQLTS